MKSKNVLSDDVRHLIFSEMYQRYSEPKARRRAFTILEGAIGLFDKKGFENVTFSMIARESGMTAPSLRHYFSNFDEIRDYSLKYLHLAAQKIVVEAMSGTDQPLEMLKRYIEAHYFWASNFKGHIRVWLSFISFSSRRKRDRALNTIAVENGASRVMALLAQGRKSGVFKHHDDHVMAKLLQTVMLGWLTTLVTEEVEDPAAYSKRVINLCLNMLLEGSFKDLSVYEGEWLHKWIE